MRFGLGLLRAMQHFDDLVIAGMATEGERQNGKGDYFNDLLAVILENASGASLNRRSGVEGLHSPNHNLDVTFPPAGQIVDVLVEAKRCGDASTSGERFHAEGHRAAGLGGHAEAVQRGRVQDHRPEGGLWDASVREWSAATGRHLRGPDELAQNSEAERGDPIAGIRVTSKRDRDAVLAVATSMTQVMDGVGLFLYSAVGYAVHNLSPARYEAVAVPSQFELPRVLQRITLDLRDAARQQSAAASAALPPAPAAHVASVLAATGVDDGSDDPEEQST